MWADDDDWSAPTHASPDDVARSDDELYDDDEDFVVDGADAAPDAAPETAHRGASGGHGSMPIEAPSEGTAATTLHPRAVPTPAAPRTVVADAHAAASAADGHVPALLPPTSPIKSNGARAATSAAAVLRSPDGAGRLVFSATDVAAARGAPLAPMRLAARGDAPQQSGGSRGASRPSDTSDDGGGSPLPASTSLPHFAAQTWALPPPFKDIPRWTYEPSGKCMIHGRDVLQPHIDPYECRARADREAVSQAPRGAVRRRRPPSFEQRGLPWLPAHKGVRALVAPNGHPLFAHPRASLLDEKAKRARDRALAANLRGLRRKCAAFEPDLYPVGYDDELGCTVALDRTAHRDAARARRVLAGQAPLGRQAATLREMETEILRTIQSPWLPGLGRLGRLDGETGRSVGRRPK
ncbi:hypothetical protein M885DRAFT_517066 [Pelagophyceae sp. CCMP2097]|nr:hypothetical protein M885DRAFT_517066 [Pelagophyceae sp. CCMP2097]